MPFIELKIFSHKIHFLFFEVIILPTVYESSLWNISTVFNSIFVLFLLLAQITSRSSPFSLIPQHLIVKILTTSKPFIFQLPSFLSYDVSLRNFSSQIKTTIQFLKLDNNFHSNFNKAIYIFTKYNNRKILTSF